MSAGSSSKFKEILGIAEGKDLEFFQAYEPQVRDLIRSDLLDSDVRIGPSDHTVGGILDLLADQEDLSFHGYVVFYSDRKPKVRVDSISFKARSHVKALAWTQYFHDADDVHWYPDEESILLFLWWFTQA